MDLNLTSVRTVGRAPKAIATHVVRPLKEEDLALLGEEKGSAPPPIKALRARHHTLARLLAQGTSVNDCVAITGYSISRISILKSDPTFNELMAYYEKQVEEVYLDTHARLGELTTDALEILRDRMEADDTQFSVGQLTELVKLGADRTGHGPSSTQNTNVTVGFASRLEEARKRAKMIDITPEVKDAPQS